MSKYECLYVVVDTSVTVAHFHYEITRLKKYKQRHYRFSHTIHSRELQIEWSKCV